MTAPPALAAEGGSTAIGLIDSKSAPSEVAARQLASAFDHAVVIDSATTATSQTSALPDGTMQLEQNSVPVRVKTASGWTAVDSGLVAGSDGFYAPVATNTPVKFSAGGSTVLAKVQTSTGKWLRIASPFGVLPTPSVRGAVATYAGVLPGVDLRLTANAVGMSQVMVIHSAKAAANPLLKKVEFNLSGAVLKSLASGVSTATADDGSALVSSSPTWWDSSQGSDATGPAGFASAEPVVQSSDSSSLSLDAIASTSSRDVVYPVYVDPDFTGAMQAYTYVDQAYPGQSYWNGNLASGVQRMGYITAAYSPDNKNHLARAYWQMNTASVAGKHIIAAAFNVTETGSFNCTPTQVNLYTSGPISAGTTWSAQPALGTFQSSQVVAHGYNASCPAAAVGFNAVNAVTTAAASSQPSVTFQLRANSESSVNYYKKWAQSGSLIITYKSDPNVPSAPKFSSPSRTCGTASSPTALVGNQPIGMQATVTHPDAGTNVGATFAVINGTTSAAVASYSSSIQAPGAQTATIPASTLATGLYAWRATATDGTYTSTAASPLCYFQIITGAPALPGVTKTSTGTPNVGLPMTVSFTSTSADGVGVFAYWWAIGNGTVSPTPPVVTPIVPGQALPACGSASGAVRFACPDSGSTNATNITVAPIDTVSTLWVASYNVAGQVSISSGSYAAKGLPVLTGADTVGVSNAVGHIWDSQNITTAATAVPDLNTTTGTTGSTTRQTLGAPLNLVNGSFDGIPTTVLNYTTASTASFSARQAIDTKNSFTVSTWMYASPTSSSAVAHVALSESSFGSSAFTLGTAAGGALTFCRTSQVNSSQACAVGTNLAKGKWTLVTGIWDSVNQNLRVLVNGSIVANGVAPQPVPPSDTSATGWFCVGGACSVNSGNVVTIQPWDGQIFRPAAMPGVVSASQLDNLYSVLSPNDDPPVDESIGAVVNIGCDELITPQEIYDYNPNFHNIEWDPAVGTSAQKAVNWNGLACRWVSESGNVPIDISVASIVDLGTMVQLQDDAAAGGTPVANIGDSAYFRMVNANEGELQVFSGGYWLTFRSPWFWSGNDADPLPAIAIANLP